MKRKMIALTAFMAVVLAGCGQIDEPLTTTNSNNQAAAQIEVQTASKTDAPTESTTETEKTTASQQTTEETTNIASIAEIQAEDNAVNAVSENNDTPQLQAEEKQSATKSEKPVTTASTTQATTTQAETTNAPVIADSGQSADVFKMLDSLNYHAISCDGLPEYQLTASDGTVYLLNISSSWVWRRPSLIAEADNEAPLTQEVIDAIYANWNNLNIVKTEW